MHMNLKKISHTRDKIYLHSRIGNNIALHNRWGFYII